MISFKNLKSHFYMREKEKEREMEKGGGEEGDEEGTNKQKECTRVHTANLNIEEQIHFEVVTMDTLILWHFPQLSSIISGNWYPNHLYYIQLLRFTIT